MIRWFGEGTGLPEVGRQCFRFEKGLLSASPFSLLAPVQKDPGGTPG